MIDRNFKREEHQIDNAELRFSHWPQGLWSSRYNKWHHLLSHGIEGGITLTSLSHPADTITGFEGFGENRTQLTHSPCPSSVMVNLQSPKVFQSLIVLSRLPLTICRLSAEKETERTSLVWPTKRRVVLPVLRSQRRRVLSHEAERAYWPSEEITTSWTKWLWPCTMSNRRDAHMPLEPSLGSHNFGHREWVARRLCSCLAKQRGSYRDFQRMLPMQWPSHCGL